MPQRASTQSTLSILDIKDDTVILSGGRFRMVMRVKAINFDLLSEDEQDAIIYAYASLINALEFPLQILVKTRQLNISGYIDYLSRFKASQPNPTLKAQIDSYQNFVNKLVVENNVLFKTFYVVVPYDMSVADKTSIFDPIINLIPTGQTAPTYSQADFTTAKEKLVQRRDELAGQFQRIGLKVTQLTTNELVELYYSLYNPTEAGMNQVQGDLQGYTEPMVRPAVGW